MQQRYAETGETGETGDAPTITTQGSEVIVCKRKATTLVLKLANPRVFNTESKHRF